MEDLLSKKKIDLEMKKDLLKKNEESEAVVLDDGSTYIPERLIPLPESISKEARLWLAKATIPVATTAESSFEDFRKEGDRIIKIISDRIAASYPVNVTQTTIDGVLCDCLTPKEMISPDNRDKLLIVLSGGMGLYGQKGLSESIPMANLLKVKIIKPHYRLMPEYAFPDNVDDVFAVYRRLIEEAQPNNIGILGASNGGVMCFQLMVKLLANNLPLPGAIASWGGGGGFAGSVDSVMTNRDLDPLGRMRVERNFRRWKKSLADNLSGNWQKKLDPRDPFRAPFYADLSGLPPTLLSTGTRDLALSDVVLMHQVLREQKVEADLLVFEGMPHGFKFHSDLPEAKKLYNFTAEFFRKNLVIQ